MTQSGSKPSLLWHCSVVLRGFGFGVKKGSHAYSEIVFGYLEHWSTDMYSRSQAIKCTQGRQHSSSPIQWLVIFLPPSHLCALVGLRRSGESAGKCYMHISATWAKILSQNIHSAASTSLWDQCFWPLFSDLFDEGSPYTKTTLSLW